MGLPVVWRVRIYCSQGHLYDLKNCATLVLWKQKYCIRARSLFCCNFVLFRPLHCPQPLENLMISSSADQDSSAKPQTSPSSWCFNRLQMKMFEPHQIGSGSGFLCCESRGKGIWLSELRPKIENFSTACWISEYYSGTMEYYTCRKPLLTFLIMQ